MQKWQKTAVDSLALALVALVLWWAWHNVQANTQALGVGLGFGFLFQPAGFAIVEKWIAYQPQDPSYTVWLVGLINMLVVTAATIVAATVIGLVVAVMRMSHNRLLSATGGAYVSIFRNLPVLLQILFWYNLWINKMPSVYQSWTYWGVIINNRGIYLPTFSVQTWLLWLLLGSACGAYASFTECRKIGLGKVLLGAGLLWWLGSALFSGVSEGWLWPVRSGFRIRHAWHIYPEFLGLWIGLSCYTGAFCAEIFRAGLAGIPTGQKEAAQALGLSFWLRVRHVLLPQAYPSVIPPLTSQYVNSQKNASLGVAVGYPEIFSVFAGTVLNQTGRAVEIMLITMVTYYVCSTILTRIMAAYNERFSVWTRTQQG